jgi:hypothetical protein
MFSQMRMEYSCADYQSLLYTIVNPFVLKLGIKLVYVYSEDEKEGNASPSIMR